MSDLNLLHTMGDECSFWSILPYTNAVLLSFFSFPCRSHTILALYLSQPEYMILSLVFIISLASMALLKAQTLHCNLRGEERKVHYTNLLLGKIGKPGAVGPNRCRTEGKIMDKQVISIYQEKLIGKRILNKTNGLRRLCIQQCTEHSSKPSQCKA